MTADAAGAKTSLENDVHFGMPYGAPRTTGPRRGMVIAVVAVILVCIVVAAALLVVLDRKDDPMNGLGSDRGIKNGSWAEYRMGISGENLFAYGTCRVTYSNVTEHSYVMTMIMTANGKTATESMTVFQKGNVWEVEGSGIPGVSMTVLGNETTSTPIGLKNTTHIRTVTPEYVEDDWFHSSGCIISADVNYTDGSRMTLVLVGTNIECVWD